MLIFCRKCPIIASDNWNRGFILEISDINGPRPISYPRSLVEREVFCCLEVERESVIWFKKGSLNSAGVPAFLLESGTLACSPQNTAGWVDETTEISLSCLWRLGSPRSRYWPIQFLMTALFLADGRLLTGLAQGPSSVPVWEERSLSLPLLPKLPIPPRGPHPYDLTWSNPNYFWKAPSPKAITSRVRIWREHKHVAPGKWVGTKGSRGRKDYENPVTQWQGTPTHLGDIIKYLQVFSNSVPWQLSLQLPISLS